VSRAWVQILSNHDDNPANFVPLLRALREVHLARPLVHSQRPCPPLCECARIYSCGYKLLGEMIYLQEALDDKQEW